MNVKTLYDDLKRICDVGETLIQNSADKFYQQGFSTAILLLKSKETSRTEFIQDIIDGKLKGAEARRVAIQKFT